MWEDVWYLEREVSVHLDYKQDELKTTFILASFIAISFTETTFITGVKRFRTKSSDIVVDVD